MYIHHVITIEVLYLSSTIFHDKKITKKSQGKKIKKLKLKCNKKNYDSINCHFILLLFVYVREKCKFYDSMI